MSMIWTPDRQIIAPSRRVWTPPSRQRGFVCLPGGGLGAGRPGGGGGGYNIPYSLIYKNSTNSHFYRTPGVAGNRKAFTWSGWLQRGVLQNGVLIGADNGTIYTLFRIEASYIALIHVPNTSGTTYNWRTSNAFTGTSAFYHIVLGVDTTQATAANRLSIEVDGVAQTLVDASGYGAIPQNTDFFINSTVQHMVGRFIRGANNQLAGKLAMPILIDGQKLAASNFGETIGGLWKPKEYTGTYGTCGFRQDYANNSSATTLGYDVSGNGNHFTPSGIATADRSTDTPTS